MLNIIKDLATKRG